MAISNYLKIGKISNEILLFDASIYFSIPFHRRFATHLAVVLRSRYTGRPLTREKTGECMYPCNSYEWYTRYNLKRDSL